MCGSNAREDRKSPTNQFVHVIRKRADVIQCGTCTRPWPRDWPPTVRLPSALAPHVRHSSTKQFNRIQSCVFSLSLASSPLFSLSHVRHPPRSSDTERQTFPKHHKPQCRSCIIQNQDDCSQGAPFSCSNVSSPHLYPQLYCVRPNSGKVDPGQTVEVQGAISLIVFNAVG